MQALSGIFPLVMAIVTIAGTWKVFEKAGYPGWAILVPFYNIYIFIRVAGRPGWWFLLFFVPLVNLVIAIILNFDIAKRFDKEWSWGLGLLFFGFIFYPVLGFGEEHRYSR